MRCYMMTLMILAGCLLGVFLAGMQHFAHRIRIESSPEQAIFAIAAARSTQTGIVVVTGSGGRIEAGLNLLIEGEGSRMLISGTGKRVSKQNILHVITPQQNGDSVEIQSLMSCCIDLGPAARNTKGNANETRRWADDHDLSRIILVTADFHIPRALIEFRRQMPSHTVIPHAVPTKGLGVDQNGLTQWWQSGIRVLTILREYAKYLASLVG